MSSTQVRSYKKKNLMSFLVLGHGLIGSLCMWITNSFLELWGVSLCVWLTSSPDHGFLVQRSCARPHRCWAWTHLCPAGCASTRQQTHSKHVNTQSRKKKCSNAYLQMSFFVPVVSRSVVFAVAGTGESCVSRRLTDWGDVYPIPSKIITAHVKPSLPKGYKTHTCIFNSWI